LTPQPRGAPMTDQPDGLILTVNSGSSSLKAALYAQGGDARLVARGQLDRIGLHGGKFQMAGVDGKPLEDRGLDLPDHAAALHALFDWLEVHHGADEIRAVGHRVVHGGP